MDTRRDMVRMTSEEIIEEHPTVSLAWTRAVLAAHGVAWSEWEAEHSDTEVPGITYDGSRVLQWLGY